MANPKCGRCHRTPADCQKLGYRLLQTDETSNSKKPLGWVCEKWKEGYCCPEDKARYEAQWAASEAHSQQSGPARSRSQPAHRRPATVSSVIAAVPPAATQPATGRALSAPPAVDRPSSLTGSRSQPAGRRPASMAESGPPTQQQLLTDIYRQQLAKDAMEFRQARDAAAKGQAEWFEAQVAALRASFNHELQPLLDAGVQFREAEQLAGSLKIKICNAESLQATVQAVLRQQQNAADSFLTAATRRHHSFMAEQEERQKLFNDSYLEEKQEREKRWLAEQQERRESYKKCEQEWFEKEAWATIAADAATAKAKRPTADAEPVRSAPTKQTTKQQGNDKPKNKQRNSQQKSTETKKPKHIRRCQPIQQINAVKDSEAKPAKESELSREKVKGGTQESEPQEAVP